MSRPLLSLLCYDDRQITETMHQLMTFFVGATVLFHSLTGLVAIPKKIIVAVKNRHFTRE